MAKYIKIIIALFLIVLGYVVGLISWGGTYDFGNPTNTILFCCSSPLVIGGVVYLIIVLSKRKNPVV
jgi:nitrate/TMAO reductase-like tetraheme cytochrome c subunit